MKFIIVFDGTHMPANAATNEARRTTRNAARGLLRSEGVSAEESRKEMVKAVSIAWCMVTKVNGGLHEAGFAYMVVPFEADGQLAHLCRERIVDAVLDSGHRSCRSRMPTQLPGYELLERHGLSGDPLLTLREYAAPAGCDYKLCNLRGIGPMTAIKLMQRHGLDVDDMAVAVRGDHGPSLPAKIPSTGRC